MTEDDTFDLAKKAAGVDTVLKEPDVEVDEEGTCSEA